MTRWVAVTVALATACSGKEQRDRAAADEAKVAVTPAPVEQAPPEPAATVPLGCLRYGAAIKRLAGCHELPAAMRDLMLETYQLAQLSWAHLRADEVTTIESACLRAANQAREVAKTCSFDVEYPVPGLETLPEACQEYAAAVELLASCDKLPKATRDALRDSYQQTKDAWASVPAEGRAALGTACTSAAEAVKQSAAACN